MIRKWLGIVLLVITAATLLVSSSCARSQQLTGITVSPSSFTYFSPAPPGVTQTPIPLTAYGSYIHPPANKNVTTQAVWASNNPNVANVASGGAMTAGAACGVADISASVYTDNGNMNGNVVVGFMTVTVEGPASEGCPTSTATSNLTVNITAGAADGVITSAPSGINCGSTCAAAFPTSSSVALTATPNSGKSFLGWATCPSVSGSGLTCTVIMNGDQSVSASFN
jgi:Divergent InlB B-repeat domain